MKNLKSILVLFLFIVTFKVSAQQIKNVDFNVTSDNKMIINYDLINCPKNKMFNLKLKIISTSGNVINPISIEGDLIHVKEGTNKQIEWNVLNDLNDLKDDIYVTLEITKSYYSKIVGGPSNAFLSILLPGLGDIGVNRYANNIGTNDWYYVSGIFIGSAAYTYWLSNAYKKDYAKYQASTIQTEMDTYYNSANTYYKNYQLMIGITSAIWITDVLYVTIKGFRNRKFQLYERNITDNNNQNFNLTFSTTPSTFQIGFVKRL